MNSANNFLKEYINSHNQRFSVESQSLVSEYKSVSKNLQEVFCIKEMRQVASDHTISFRGETYLISERFKYSISKQKIEIRIYPNQEWEAFFGVYPIKLVKIDKVNRFAA